MKACRRRWKIWPMPWGHPAGSMLQRPAYSQVERPELPQGTLTAQNACLILAALQPENAIIVNESITSGAAYFPLGPGLPPHTLLMLPGGLLAMECPAPSAPPSPALSDRSSIFRPTAAPCIRCRRFGCRPGNH